MYVKNITTNDYDNVTNDYSKITKNCANDWNNIITNNSMWLTIFMFDEFDDLQIN